MILGVFPGSFDLLHAGHVLALEDAKSQCDFLIVLLQADPTLDRPEKNAPVQSLEERRIQLKGCKYVDQIIVYQTEAGLLHYLEENKACIYRRFLGADWRGKEFTGHDIKGIWNIFLARDHDFSSSELRCRIADN